MKTLEQMADAQATGEAKKSVGINESWNGSNSAEDLELTTADELMNRHKSQVVKLSTHTEIDKQVYRIQTIDPFQHFVAIGSPLTAKLQADGIDMADRDKVQEYVKGLSVDEQLELSFSAENIDNMRRVVCAGVTSVKFSMKTPDDIEPGSGIASVHVLRATSELPELFAAIMKLSSPESEVNLFSGFPEENKDEGGEKLGGSDSGDVAVIPGEPVRVIVSESVAISETGGE